MVRGKRGGNGLVIAAEGISGSESISACGSVRQPDDVLVVWGGHVQWQGVIEMNRSTSAGVAPFFDFGVTVGKGNSAGTVVIAGWEINDSRTRGIFDHHVSKPAGVNAVGVFVQQHISHGRIVDIRPLKVGVVFFAAHICAEPTWVEPVTRPGPLLTHAHASQSRNPNSIGDNRADVSRAMIDPNIFEVSCEFRARRVGQRARVSVIQIAAVIVFPTIHPRGGLDRPGIPRGGQLIAVVIRIQKKYQLQLFEIVEALDALGFDFCL